MSTNKYPNSSDFELKTGRYVSHKNLKAVAKDLKLVYTATTEKLAEQALIDFAQRWDR